MDIDTIRAFSTTMQKLAGRSPADLLVSMAKRKGVNPQGLGAIKQVSRIAGEDRGRAAAIAKNVRNYLKTPKAA